MTDTNLNKWFGRNAGKHFVSLTCTQFLPDDKENGIVFSGFITEVCGLWMYLTAGHTLRKIEEALNAGAKFDHWRLGDETARGPYSGKPIPIDFNPTQWLVLDDRERGIDYAVFPLRELYKRGLEEGGAKPVPRDAWGSHFAPHDYWVLFGVPEESVDTPVVGQIAAKALTLVLEPAESPEGKSEKDLNRFYANLVGDSVDAVKSVKGMSGGPVFALKRANGVWTYSVIGVQSGWFVAERTIIACPFATFALAIQDLLVSEGIVDAEGNLCGEHA